MNCAVQVYVVEDRAFGFQFHIEATKTTGEDGIKIAAYKKDLEQILGATGCGDLQQAIKTHLPTVKRQPKIVFDNFLAMVKKLTD